MAKAAHREGTWKQSNKTHKTGQHRSKGAVRNSVRNGIYYEFKQLYSTLRSMHTECNHTVQGP